MLIALVVAGTLVQDADLARRLDSIVRRLESDAIEVREAASADLRALVIVHGPAVREPLRMRLAGRDAETRARLQAALDRIDEVRRRLEEIMRLFGGASGEERKVARVLLSALAAEHGEDVRTELRGLLLREDQPARLNAESRRAVLGAKSKARRQEREVSRQTRLALMAWRALEIDEARLGERAVECCREPGDGEPLAVRAVLSLQRLVATEGSP